jgi:hypothetical protein
VLSSGLVHLRADGTPAGRTSLPEVGRILDFACDPTGRCLLLDETASGQRSVRCLDATGQLWWRGTDPFLQEAAALLYRGGDHACLPTSAGRIAILSAGSGQTLLFMSHAPGAGRSFLGHHQLLSVFYDDATNLRGISRLDPVDGTETVLQGTHELFPWLVYPFGADHQQRLYVWRQGQIARITTAGAIEVLGAVNEQVVRTTTDQTLGAWLAAGEVQLAPFEAWQVDADGSLVLAVTTATGLILLRVSWD